MLEKRDSSFILVPRKPQAIQGSKDLFASREVTSQQVPPRPRHSAWVYQRVYNAKYCDTGRTSGRLLTEFLLKCSWKGKGVADC